MTARMPAAFVGHGTPMNTLEVNRFTRQWRELGQRLPRPRAILCISAHWFIHGSAVTAMPRPRVIHDFYGFPRELFAFDYPAPGSPEIAQEIVDVVKPSFVGLDTDSWGLDHGTWSVLAHMFPQADIPVLQLSIHGGEPMDYHVALGAKLAPLRERGIFILGSGNVVHNLRLLDRSRGDVAYDWGESFDAEVKQVMRTRPADLPSVQRHPAYAMAVPTPEHFLPLAYIAGLASASGEVPQAFAEGGVMGALTMTSYTLGMPAPGGQDGGGGDSMPNPRSVPPEQTNI